MRKKVTQTISTKVSKTILLINLCLITIGIKAQSPVYSFSQSSGTYSAITGGTVYSSGSSMDDASIPFTIPFTFTFNTTPYTSGHANENGYISFGSTVPNASTRRVISNAQTGFQAAAPFAQDLGGLNGSSEMRGEILGSAPNRTFVVQWSNMVEYLGDFASFNFQVRISEGGGVEANQKIEFVYGNCTNTWADLSPQVGLRGLNNTQFINRTSTGTSWLTNTAGTGNNDGCFFSSTNASIAPVSGLTFIWSRMYPVVTYTGSLSSFITCSGIASPTQTLAVSGSSLAANILITAPSGMEVSSTSPTAGFSNAVTLTQSNFTVAPTTLYLRIASAASGTISGNVTISNFGTTTQSIAVTGTANALPAISVNSGVICSGQSFTMAPSGAVTYTYSNGNAVVTPTANATYSVLGTDANGCVSTVDAVASVTVNALPTISVNSGAICSGQSFTMVASGADTYTYSNGSSIAAPTANATYSVSGTNTLTGCASNMDAVSSVTVNALPTISVNSGVICSGQSFTIVASGADTYTYSNGSSIATPTANATYSVSGTNTLTGCASNMDAVSSVTVNALPTVTVNSGAICSGQSFTIVASGADTYTYSNGSSVATPTANATYSVSGTNTLTGCASNMDAVSSVTVNALPTVTVNSGAICAGQSFTMVASGADTYTYSNGSSVATPTANATYSVSGTNTLTGCVSNVDAVSSVTVNALPTLTATTSNTIICSGETATLTVSGTATSYTWSTTDNTASIAVTPTTQTTYTVNGTDGNGCSNSTTVTQDVSLCTGIAQNSLTNELTVSPNPSNGIFNINVSTTYNVTILDVLGKVIYSEQLPIGTHSINLNNYSNGLYILKAESNGQSRTLRLVKH